MSAAVTTDATRRLLTLCTFIAAKPGFPSAATAGCHSAVDEHPVVPTLPLDHGCAVR